MPRAKLFVDLMAHTPLPESVVAMGARLCYSGAEIPALKQRIEENNQRAFLQKLLDMGHLSPVEHVSFTFGVQGVSRALLAQVTRHRIASFSVQSQRYVSQTGANGFSYVVPPSIAALGMDAAIRYDAQMAQMAAWYDEWNAALGKEGKEDARFVLPNACETRLIMSMNARELDHLLRVRCCERAQWEIRAMAWAMLGHLLRIAPALFEHAGPNCAVGACGEGGMSCGHAREIRARRKALAEFVEIRRDDPNFAEALSAWASDAVS